MATYIIRLMAQIDCHAALIVKYFSLLFREKNSPCPTVYSTQDARTKSRKIDPLFSLSMRTYHKF